MAYYHKVKIYWSPEILINEAWDAEDIKNMGLYFITRKYIRNGQELEYPLYVGITTRSFYKRLKEHFRDNSKWTQSYGRKYICFGTVSIYKPDKYNISDLLTEIETQIIQDINEKYPNELLNKKQINNHDDKYYLSIYHLNNSWLEEL
ncbi:MAG: GIY-YIG nuclease family protein [Bacteroidales bacterium]|nr:GIY-YIG nuclease family protein [Bacteroidales bacterium]